VIVRRWPEAAVDGGLLFRRCQGVSRHLAPNPSTPIYESFYLTDVELIATLKAEIAILERDYPEICNIKPPKYK
jgi:hypothetical protein